METIKKTEQFNYIYNKGTKIHTKYSIIFLIKSDKQEFGFVTSKKVGNAVKRNRIRRLLREVVRNNYSKIKACHSYIFVAKKSCGEENEINYNLMKEDILRGLRKYEKNINNLN